jgi:hypothetical protein
MSEIDNDIDEVLMILCLLFGENCRLKKIKFRHYGWIGSIMLTCWSIQMSLNRDFGCLGVCLMI